MFIDEAHTLIGAGGAAGTGDAANLLKPALARGTLRTVAATTWMEYQKYFEKDPALTRRFQVVQVGEPDEELGPGEVELVPADPVVERRFAQASTGEPPADRGLGAAVGPVRAQRPAVEHLPERRHAATASGGVSGQRLPNCGDGDRPLHHEVVEHELDVRRGPRRPERRA